MRPTPHPSSRPALDLGVAKLLAVSPDRRHLYLHNSRRAFSLLEDLVRHAFALRFGKLAPLLEASALAAELAEDLTPLQANRSAAELADLRAEAWMVEGNAQRIQGNLGAAERALAVAERNLRGGTGRRLDLASLHLELTASLRERQGELAEAQRLLQSAFALRCELGERNGKGKVRIQQGIAFGYAGDPVRAAALLLEAVELVNDLDLLRSALQSLIWNLAEANLERAFSCLASSRVLFAGGGELFQLKLQWLEAKLAACASPTSEDTCRRYERAHEAFTSWGFQREAACLSCDLQLLRQAGGSRG